MYHFSSLLHFLSYCAFFLVIYGRRLSLFVFVASFSTSIELGTCAKNHRVSFRSVQHHQDYIHGAIRLGKTCWDYSDTRLFGFIRVLWSLLSIIPQPAEEFPRPKNCSINIMVRGYPHYGLTFLNNLLIGMSSTMILS